MYYKTWKCYAIPIIKSIWFLHCKLDARNQSVFENFNDFYDIILLQNTVRNEVREVMFSVVSVCPRLDPRVPIDQSQVTCVLPPHPQWNPSHGVMSIHQSASGWFVFDWKVFLFALLLLFQIISRYYVHVICFPRDRQILSWQVQFLIKSNNLTTDSSEIALDEILLRML